MVNMAGGMDRWRVRPTTTTTSRNKAAIQRTSLILEIHVIVNWQMSNQGIRWPVSRDHIAGSGLELIEVARFFEVDRCPGTGFRVDRRLKPGYYSGGEGGGTYKAKFRREWKKIVKPNDKQLHAHNRSVVEFLAQKNAF